jgi:hypothetical protein
MSITLFTMGNANLAGGFYLRTLSSSRPTSIVGPILDMVVVSYAIEGSICEESGRRVNVYNAF